MLRGKAWTWVMLFVGLVIAFGLPVVDPIHLDNMRWHLTATAIGAAILGLGLGRSSIGRE